MSKFIFGEAIGEVLRATHFVEARNIRGGTITAQELVIAGGTKGVIRSQNYDPTTGLGWAIFGDGSATFGGDVTIEGDLLGNWDGTVPVDLSGGQDTGATTGYAIDASEGNVQFLGSVFASGIAFLDAANSNAQVGAIGGSNDELLIVNVGSNNMRLLTLTGGDIKLQPGAGGTVSLNDGSVDRFTFSVVSGAPYLEFNPVDLTNPGFIQMVSTNLGGGDIGTVSIQPPYDNGQAELTLYNAASGDGGSYVSMSSFDRVSLPAGTKAKPALAWADDGGTTGIWRRSVNQIGFSIAGTNRALIYGSGLIVGDADTGNPWIQDDKYTFFNDADTYMHRSGTNTVSFVTAGSTSLRIDAGGTLVPDGSLAGPGLSFISDTNTGMYRAAGDTFDLVAGGNQMMRIQISAGTPVIWSPAINDLTTASAANVHIGTSGSQLRRSTSSLRFKPGWQFADEDALADLEMPSPIVWVQRHETIDQEGNSVTEQDILLGFGTEHVYEMLPAATQDYNGDGEPDNYDVRSLVAILSAKVKRLEAKVAALS